jgi:POT family proton-dependent oligopeptide transporter
LKRADRQPPAFYLLLFVSAVERFCYYGFRACLALFLMRRLNVGGAEISATFATVTTVAAFAPLLGGYLADRHLGHRKAVLAGAALMSIGAAAMLAQALTYPGIGLVVAGSCLIKPSVPALLGHLYRRGDARRDAGFVFLLVAINAAAFVAPLAVGVARNFGLALGITAAGMLLGAVVFAAGQPLLRAEGYYPGEEEAPAATFSRRDARDVGLAVLGVACLTTVAVSTWNIVAPIWSPLPLAAKAGAVLALVALGFGVERARAGRDARPAAPDVWPRIGVLAILTGLAALLWQVVNLQHDAIARMAVAASRGELGATWLVSVNGVVMLVLGPCFALLCRRLDASARPISGLWKMAAGLVLVGAGGAVLALSVHGADGPIEPLVAACFLGAVGELCFVPIGDAMVTKLAPARSVAFSMAAWSAVPRVLTLIVAALGTSSADRDADGSSGLGLAIAVAAAGVALFALTPVLKRWMHGAEEPEAAAAPGAPYRSAGAGPASVGAPPDAPRASPARQMIVGAAWAIGGLLVTVLSYSATEGGGRYVVAYGAILYGVVTFFRGLAGSSPSKDR